MALGSTELHNHCRLLALKLAMAAAKAVLRPRSRAQRSPLGLPWERLTGDAASPSS